MNVLNQEINMPLNNYENKEIKLEEVMLYQGKSDITENLTITGNPISFTIKDEIHSDDEELSLKIKTESLGTKKGHRSKSDGELTGKPNLLPKDSNNKSLKLEELPLTCKTCGQGFTSLKNLEEHLKKPAVSKSFDCCACNKCFRDMTQLNVHTRIHTGEKPYGCKICLKTFSINGNLNKHMRTHTGEKRFECHVCGRKFMQLAHLEDHMTTHSAGRPFVCEQCDSGFKTKARLQKHQKSHEQEIKKKNVPCQICFRTFRSSKLLMVHMSRHTDNEFPFQCIVCEKKFTEYANYRNHLRIHKDHPSTRLAKCDICDRSFASASHLRRHLNSHTGYKPHLCHLCMRGFPNPQNLKRHMLTHTGEKPYSCETCHKPFLLLENLNRHVRTHTGEKPFPCPTCGKRFAHSTTVKEHLRIHTGEKPYGCRICDKRFGMNKVLYKHIRTRHPEHVGMINGDGNGHSLQILANIKTEPVLDDNNS